MEGQVNNVSDSSLRIIVPFFPSDAVNIKYVSSTKNMLIIDLGVLEFIISVNFNTIVPDRSEMFLELYLICSNM